MAILDKLKRFWSADNGANRSLKERFAAITELITGENDAEKRFRAGFIALVCPLLSKNGVVNEHSQNIYRRLLEEYFNIQITESHLAEFSNMELPDVETAAQLICNSFPDKALRTAEFLIALTVSTGEDSENIKFAHQAATALGMSTDNFETTLKNISDMEKRKQRLRNSSRGIIATLVIIAVFILTAKYMQSVIFGVLLACILLPIEKFYEKRIVARKGLVFNIIRVLCWPFIPLKKLSILVSRNGNQDVKLRQNPQRIKEKKAIRLAVIFTIITALIIAVAAVFGISKLTGHYMQDLQQSIRSWEEQRLLGNQYGENNTRVSYALEKLQNNFETIPQAQFALEKLKNAVQKPEIRAEITQNLIRRGGGLLTIAKEILGGFVSLMCDLLLTVFFALLFLHKFAEFKARSKQHSGSEYIVRSFFNGIWLPGADENLVEETCRIISGIIFRLRVWLKGYLTLILVDSTVYTTCFFFLGVPFFLPLGIIAGCGIALPYLGPVISCCLTLLVTIIMGGASGELLLAIIIAYLIYNGIIEQFILYPAVIGDSLGLSTLETIIVVLLGAIFAGIPGMIFSLPTASVAKFIIPQIYHGFFLRTVEKS